MTPIHEYLLSGLLPKDPRESRKIRIKAPQYKLIKGSLYKKSFFTPCLRCIAPPQVDNIIKEIHEGSCGFNAEPRSMEQSMAKKTARKDAIAAVSIWPFSHWGVNILGPLPTTQEIRGSTNNQLEGSKAFQRRHIHSSEAIILIAESIIAKDNRDTTKENAKRKESKEVASIEEASYQNKLRRYHDVRKYSGLKEETTTKGDIGLEAGAEARVAF
ncbi:hypothetical protein Tco_0737495 [Tanacetum coccineum]